MFCKIGYYITIPLLHVIFQNAYSEFEQNYEITKTIYVELGKGREEYSLGFLGEKCANLKRKVVHGCWT